LEGKTKKMKIPDNTKIKSVDLIVNDMESSLNFYNKLLGFKVIEKNSTKAYLSSNGEYPYLISLDENKTAGPVNRHGAGLYHTAFRFPDRKSLAKEFLHLHENNTKFHGFSDHIVSEAIYLGDPDGNGVELYVDKPRSEWVWKLGQVEMDTLPLNLNVLTNEMDNRNEKWTGISPLVDIGHIHLRVTDLFKAEKFYSNLLGFNITTSNYPGALFMSAGGYHHHIGANVWSSNHGSPSAENSLGLKSFTINIPDANFVEEIKTSSVKNGNEFIEMKNNEKGIVLRDYDNIMVKILSS
jgi:catechol 2,3-dioxygenase